MTDTPAPTIRWGFGVAFFWAAVVGLAMAFWNGWLVLPDRWNPWAPLWPQEAPNALTSWKLARIAADPAACAATLAASKLRYAPEPERPLARGCGWAGAVRVEALPARVGTPFVLTCPAALSLSMWERHTVQPLARELLGGSVVAIDTFGSYACRDIAGSAAGEGETGSGRRSEHATANALDVAGFTLADGRRVSVAADSGRPVDDARARFLSGVRSGACRWWPVVLGPGYNAAHRDHFHLDRGRFRACR